MKQRMLGRCNIKVSPIGLGGWPIGGLFYYDGKVHSYGKVNEAEAIRAIQRGLDLGITLFDSADVYGCGRSERILGKALEGRREEVVIATKFGSVFDFNSSDPLKVGTTCQSTGEKNVTPKYIHQACDESLKRLRTDYIDLYQLHWSDCDLKTAERVRDTLEELVEEGKIRYYGWSTDDSKLAKVFADGKHCAVVQFAMNLTRHNSSMLAFIEDMNLGGLIRGPLGMGMLAGKYRKESRLPETHYLHRVNFSEGRTAKVITAARELKELLNDTGYSPVQAAIAYLWSQSDRIVPIPGFKTVHQVEENAQTIRKGPLNENLLRQIQELFKELRIDFKGY